jgi:transposase
VDRIANDEPSVRRLVAQFPNRRGLRACYEAGPTGYELARLLDRLEVRCQVIAPALIPKAPGDKVKPTRRDCRRLARLYRAGELVCIRVTTVAEEAVRDQCRARADMLADRSRARLRLGGFLLRHGHIWPAAAPGPSPTSGGYWPALRRPRAADDLWALSGHVAGPRCRPGGDRGRPGYLV